jgi:hypothetical protein
MSGAEVFLRDYWKFNLSHCTFFASILWDPANVSEIQNVRVEILHSLRIWLIVWNTFTYASVNECLYGSHRRPTEYARMINER